MATQKKRRFTRGVSFASSFNKSGIRYKGRRDGALQLSASKRACEHEHGYLPRGLMFVRVKGETYSRILARIEDRALISGATSGLLSIAMKTQNGTGPTRAGVRSKDV